MEDINLKKMAELYDSDTIHLSFSEAGDFPTKNELLSLLISDGVDQVIDSVTTWRDNLSLDYLIEIGEYVLWSGKYADEAEKYFKTIAKIYPTDYRAYEMLGHIYSWLRDDKKKALIYYEVAFELSGSKRLEQSIKELH